MIIFFRGGGPSIYKEIKVLYILFNHEISVLHFRAKCNHTWAWVRSNIKITLPPPFSLTLSVVKIEGSKIQNLSVKKYHLEKYVPLAKLDLAWWRHKFVNFLLTKDYMEFSYTRTSGPYGARALHSSSCGGLFWLAFGPSLGPWPNELGKFLDGWILAANSQAYIAGRKWNSSKM